MSDDGRQTTQWDFWILLLKIGLVAVVFCLLFFLARRGDVAAIVVLVSLGVLALVGSGAWVVLVILDRQAQADQKRFILNARENMAFLQQQQQILNAQLAAQGRHNRDLLTANTKLYRLVGDNSNEQGLDVDALTWELVDDLDGD